MKIRVEQARQRQQLLKENEDKYKQQLREQWKKLSAMMEEYLDEPTTPLSKTLDSAMETSNSFCTVIDHLQNEIGMLVSSFTSETPIQEEPSMFSLNFPHSMHHLGETFTSCNSINNVLRYCSKYGDTDEYSGYSPVEESVFAAQKAVEEALKEKKKRREEDEKTSKSINNHLTILKDLHSLATTTTTSTVDLTNSQLVNALTGILTENCVSLMLELKKTSKELQIDGQPSHNPMILSSSVLQKPNFPTKFADSIKITLPEVLDQLVDINEQNLSKLRLVFLRTYRYYMKPHELLEQMIFRYCSVPSYDVPNLSKYKNLQTAKRLRVVVFLKAWITNHSSTDFIQEDIIESLRWFIEEIVSFCGNATFGKQLLRSMETNRVINTPSPLLKKTSASDIRKSSFRRSSAVHDLIQSVPESKSLLDFDAGEFAEQLTAYQFKNFKKISEIELLQQRFSKGDAANIKNITSNFNRIGGWFLSQILKENCNLDYRVKVLRQTISICIKLFQLKNFDGLFAVVAALGNCAIDRLRVTWDSAGRECYLLKDSFASLLKRNFKGYRKLLDTIDPPCVPFMGTFMTDLTFIEDGNPNFDKQHFVNFTGKFNKISDIVTRLIGFQDYAYNFTLDPDFSFLCTKFKQLPDDEAYELSVKLEPKKFTSNAPDQKNITKEEQFLADTLISKVIDKVFTSIEDIPDINDLLQPVTPRTRGSRLSISFSGNRNDSTGRDKLLQSKEKI